MGAKWGMLMLCTGKGNSVQNASKGILPCKSIVYVQPKDISITYSRNYTGEIEKSYYTCTCPKCGAQTDISPFRLSSTVKDFVRYRSNRSDDYER